MYTYYFSVSLFALCPACMYVISDNLDPQRASQISPMWYPANLCPAYCYSYNYIGGISHNMHYTLYILRNEHR